MYFGHGDDREKYHGSLRAKEISDWAANAFPNTVKGIKTLNIFLNQFNTNNNLKTKQNKQRFLFQTLINLFNKEMNL